MWIIVFWKWEIKWKQCLQGCFILIICKRKQSFQGKNIFAGSLESANSSILASCDHFKRGGGEKNQGFMIIRFFNPSDLIGCGGDN